MAQKSQHKTTFGLCKPQKTGSSGAREPQTQHTTWTERNAVHAVAVATVSSKKAKLSVEIRTCLEWAVACARQVRFPFFFF